MLTTQEIATLMDSLDAWESMAPESVGNILSNLIVGMARDNGRDAKAAQEMVDAKEKDLDRQRQERRERSIMLKAKLIQMRGEIILAEAQKAAA